MNTGITPGAPVVLTPASKVMDEPTTFWFDDKPYEPKNFTRNSSADHSSGALAHSINVAAVKSPSRSATRQWSTWLRTPA